MSRQFVWFNFVVFPFCCQEVNRHYITLLSRPGLTMHWQEWEEKGFAAWLKGPPSHLTSLDLFSSSVNEAGNHALT